ncbi:MAG: patatin-like phospholipase family protein [Christensenellaceae bacterium]|nr:patatin-like phospholipase family protein [Christensenellaceae bacterium]
MMQAEPKIGLALGGGAFRGLAHIGVLQVFDEAKLPVRLVSGCSMGALIGGLYCSGMDMRLLERYVYTLDERSLADVILPRQGLLAGARIEGILRTLTGNKSFAQMKIPFSALAVDIERGELLSLSEGPIWQAIRASISIPGVFRPLRLGGRLLVDGGVLCRVPTDAVRAMGADFIISVDVSYHGGFVPCDGLSSIIMQAFAVMEWALIKEKVVTSDVNIAPDLLHINMASILQAEDCIEIGRQAARAALPAIEEGLAKKRAQ